MKTLVIGICSIAFAGMVWAQIPVEQEVAVSGCCKQKVGDTWRRIGDDFDSCKTLNEADDDNVFEQSGTYWWDVSC